jgi:hypothetical protein
VIERILVNDDKLDIEVAPITLVYNKNHLKTQYPERVEISSFETLKHFNEMTEIDPLIACFFKFTVFDYKEEVNITNIRNSGTGYKHLIGLFSLTFKCMLENKKFIWMYPENYLHPALQAELADVCILISDQNKFLKFVECVKNKKFDSYIKKDGGNLKKYFFDVVLNGYLDSFTNS